MIADAVFWVIESAVGAVGVVMLAASAALLVLDGRY